MKGVEEEIGAGSCVDGTLHVLRPPVEQTFPLQILGIRACQYVLPALEDAAGRHGRQKGL